MTAQDEGLHWQIRREQVAHIARRPEAYKVCDQCRSLASRSVSHCPFCAAYRFIEDIEYIRATLAEMAGRALPLGAPVVPRIQPEPTVTLIADPPRMCFP